MNAPRAAAKPPARGASACPLCGDANQCAMAADTGEPCWCASVAIPASTLERIAPEDRGVACICPACAAGSSR